MKNKFTIGPDSIGKKYDAVSFWKKVIEVCSEKDLHLQPEDCIIQHKIICSQDCMGCCRGFEDCCNKVLTSAISNNKGALYAYARKQLEKLLNPVKEHKTLCFLSKKKFIKMIKHLQKLRQSIDENSTWIPESQRNIMAQYEKIIIENLCRELNVQPEMDSEFNLLEWFAFEKHYRGGSFTRVTGHFKNGCVKTVGVSIFSPGELYNELVPKEMRLK